MAEETKQPAALVAVPPPAEEVTVIAEKAASAVPEVSEKTSTTEEDDKIGESGSFKEESNVVADLPNPQQKALDEFKELVRHALEKHEFTSPPPPPPAKAEEAEKKADPVPPAEDKKESESLAAPPANPEKIVETKMDEKTTPPPPPPASEKGVKTKEEEEKTTPPPPSEHEVIVEKVEQNVEAVAEEIKETIVEVTTPPPPPLATEEEETTKPPPLEEVSIWGIKLLQDEKTDTILLKFLRARDFKVKQAFTMLKNVVEWRNQFKIDKLVNEDSSISEGLENIVYTHGVDKEGHPVIYNTFGEFQNKELYQNGEFLKGIIVFLEKSIRNLDFKPDGISTLFQVIDLKNSPGLFFFKKDLRQAVNQALQIFQDNYPEFVAKQVYINVPWWYPASYRMISSIFTSRTKSKFVFAGPSRSAETLFKYIAPEKVPAQYGGLSREGEQEFTTNDPTTEEIIKPSSKHTVEFEVIENCNLLWELRVVGWDVSYGAEFVPSAEGGYTIIVQKLRKIGVADEPIISNGYKSGEPGKVVLTFDNQTSKRKKLLYRSKTKSSQ